MTLISTIDLVFIRHYIYKPSIINMLLFSKAVNKVLRLVRALDCYAKTPRQ